jgi:pyridoxine 5-phosphate synthase
MTAKLNVNIDHVATIREARKTIEPSIITAAVICEQAGANGITVHLRGDRRHIQDRDIELLRDVVTTYLNVEMAATDEMTGIAIRTKPDAVSLVPRIRMRSRQKAGSTLSAISKTLKRRSRN